MDHYSIEKLSSAVVEFLVDDISQETIVLLTSSKPPVLFIHIFTCELMKFFHSY